MVDVVGRLPWAMDVSSDSLIEVGVVDDGDPRRGSCYGAYNHVGGALADRAGAVWVPVGEYEDRLRHDEMGVGLGDVERALPLKPVGFLVGVRIGVDYVLDERGQLVRGTDRTQ